MTEKKVRKILISIVITSVLLSLGYAFFYKINPVVDSQAYNSIAQNLLEGNGFREDANASYEFDTSIVRAGPGYEFFLAGVYKVFGYNFGVVWVIQALLHGLTVLLIFFTSRLVFKNKLYNNTIALLASAAFAFHPDLIEISAMILTETLYLFFTVLVVYLFVLHYHNPKKLILSVLLGIVLGVGLLSRPPLLLFIPIIAIWFATKRNWRGLLAFIVATTIVLLPWVVRNYQIYNQIILTTMVAEYNIWIGNTLLSTGGQISDGFNAVTAYTEKEGFFTFKKHAKQEFYTFILLHPFVFIKLCLLRIIRYFSLIRPMGFWFYQTGISQGLFVISSFISISLIFIAGFSGFFLALLKDQREKLYFYLIALATTAPIVLLPTVVQSRYRFQIYPFLMIFGAYFIINLYKKHTQAKKILQKVLTFFIIVSVLDIILFWETIIIHIQPLIS